MSALDMLSSHQPFTAGGTLQEREAKLTHQLKQRLQPYVDGQFDAFIKTMTEEADKLSESTFGIPMLKTIGYDGNS